MDIMKILGMAKFPTEEELHVLGEIASEQKDVMISLWKAFYYGTIQGKRKERAKRKTSLLASEIIADQQKQIADIMQVIDNLLKTMSKEDLKNWKQALLPKKESPAIRAIISHIDTEIQERQ